MNLSNVRSAFLLSCLLSTTLAGYSSAQEPAAKGGQSVSPADSNSELTELVRRTQNLAMQTQEELKRSREQSEALQRQLEQTSKELLELRLEVNRLRSAVTAQAPALSATTSPATPQSGSSTPASNSTESSSDLASRVTRLEDQVQVANAQIKEQAQTKLESDSRFKVRLYGSILSNTYVNTSDSPNNAIPTMAPPSSSEGAPAGANLGATLRQTNFGFAMTGPRLGKSRLSADIDFDFFGGESEGDEGNVLGALRVRTAVARIDGPRTSFVMGLMSPMISPLNPTSLASVAYPALGESGNLWQWRPQFIVERRKPLDEQSNLVFQGGLMMPFGETVNGMSLGGEPGYETRVAFAKRLDAERRFEVGAGGYFYRDLFSFDRAVDSYAATTDWVIPLGRKFELSGEAYYGQSISLGEESGSNIAEVFALSGPVDNPSTAIRGIHSAGGWTQVAARVTPRLEFNFALGLDDRRNRDILAGLFHNSTVLRNQTYSVNSIYRLRSNFLVSLEYRHLQTTYPDARATNNHINLALAYAF